MTRLPLFDIISKASLYLAVLLLPLWFLPFTQDAVGYQKQVLLLVLVFLGLISWLAKAVNQGELTFRLTWLHIPVALVVAGFGISTLFSKWVYGSFWGWPLDVNDSFVTISLFALLYFLIVNTVENSVQLFRLCFMLVVSGVVAGIINLLQLYQVFLIPFSFAKNANFNTIGATNSVALFSAVLLPLALVLAFVSRLLLRWVLWALVLVLLFVLIAVNFPDAWIALTGGLLVLLAFGMWNLRKRAEFGWVSFPMALILVALFFIVFRVALPGGPRVPVEVSPSPAAEMQMVKGVMQEGRTLVGSGPGTFVLDYAQHHSPELNQSIFWGTRFASGASEFLDALVTKGIVGMLFFIGLVASTLFFGARMLLRSSQDSFAWMLGLGSLASFVAIVIGQVLYPSNFSLSFLFWVLAGAVGIFVAGELRKASVTSRSFVALGSSFVFLLTLIFGLGLLFVSGQKYIAEARYLEGVRASQTGDMQKAMDRIGKAAGMNPSVDLYWRDLAQLHLAEVDRVSKDASLSSEQKQEQTRAAVQNAIAFAQRAVTTAPANIANWNVQGFVYRNLIGVPGADTFAIAAYEKATQLEPASPFSFTELARVYILQAQSLSKPEAAEQKKQAYEKALEQLKKALELKVDYSPAHYLTAVVYDQQGKSAEAIQKLVEAKDVLPNDTGLAFQLGSVYWQKKDYEKARLELERAKRLNPNYANARYLLGLVYDAQKQSSKAKEEFAFLVASNPNNEEVKAVLANLEKGKPALEGISVSQPPLEEAPPEIQN